MHCGEDDSPSYITSYQNGPYSSSLASSASSSAASVWSDTASQSSDDSSLTGAPFESQSSQTYNGTSQPALSSTTSHTGCDSITSDVTSWQKVTLQGEAPAQQRQHPRRTSIGSATRSGCPPSLVRQSDRKVNFVDSLVGKSTTSY